MRNVKYLLLSLLLVSLVFVYTGCGAKTEEPLAPEPTVEEPVVEEPVTEPAAGSEKVVTAVCDPWPPFVDPDSPGQGISIEIVTAAFKEEGYELKLEIMPWARAEEGVKSGTYDILPNLWYTDARAEELLYGDEFAKNEVSFIKLKGDPFEFDGLESLKGKTVGVVRDYGYGDEFSSSVLFTREESNDMIQNVGKLIAKRIDLTLEDKIVISSMMNKEDPALLDQVEFTENPLSVNTLHIASGLANPRSEEIIDAYNKGLAAIRANGIYDLITDRYGIK